MSLGRRRDRRRAGDPRDGRPRHRRPHLELAAPGPRAGV